MVSCYLFHVTSLTVLQIDHECTLFHSMNVNPSVNLLFCSIKATIVHTLRFPIHRYYTTRKACCTTKSVTTFMNFNFYAQSLASVTHFCNIFHFRSIYCVGNGTKLQFAYEEYCCLNINIPMHFTKGVYSMACLKSSFNLRQPYQIMRCSVFETFKQSLKIGL